MAFTSTIFPSFRRMYHVNVFLYGLRTVKILERTVSLTLTAYPVISPYLALEPDMAHTNSPGKTSWHRWSEV